MYDFENAPREHLKEMTAALGRCAERMNWLPYEMVSFYIKSNEEERTKAVKLYWAEFLEYMAKRVREAQPENHD